MQGFNAVGSDKLESKKCDDEVEVLKVNLFTGLNLRRPLKARVKKRE